ncbi:hypothetical protein [Roseateles oligotrophus]|uniref:Uncharacterized protein n=1 Tax=Roseateles oligotrophus TaxID=1769250 RepID=A0ABT2YE58_9BURK|nr:hypothetical protein [Roseateles oligotrophus]MCV2368314.1 hypothetical protein [Roseateles oligotrophus]
MNMMFKRIAAMIDKPSAAKDPRWVPGAPRLGNAGAGITRTTGEDFRDTDIAVAWLCEASNKTRLADQAEAR